MYLQYTFVHLHSAVKLVILITEIYKLMCARRRAKLNRDAAKLIWRSLATNHKMLLYQTEFTVLVMSLCQQNKGKKRKKTKNYIFIRIK